MFQSRTDLAGDGSGPTESHRHRLLASTQRRLAIDVLADRSEPIGVTELAASIASRTDETAGGAATEERRTAVRLHHCHLPMLDDAGLLDYDPTTGRVDPSESSLDRLQ